LTTVRAEVEENASGAAAMRIALLIAAVTVVRIEGMVHPCRSRNTAG
jgi:hypothetical protein